MNPFTIYDGRFTTFAAVQLSIIIVNYNVRYFLEQCLFSVQAAIKEMEAEVIVVDNASTDSSLAYLQPVFPWVKWIKNEKNSGFGLANNQAVSAASGEYVLFLNPDTLVPEDCLKDCVSFMQAHPDAGALGVKMLDGSGRYLPESKRGYPSLLTSFFKLSGLTARFPHSKVFARYYLGHLPQNENHPVDVLAGAFMLVRHSILQQVGAFDERFFMYGEDIDLSYRIQQAGWQNWYFANSSIIHFKGESTKKGSLNYVRMFYQAMNLFVQKHYSGRRATVYRWFIQIAIGARAGISVVAAGIKKAGKFFTKRKTKAVTDTHKIVVIATDRTTNEIRELLGFAKASKQTISYLTVQAEDARLLFERKKDTLHYNYVVFGIDAVFDLETVLQQMEQLSGEQFGFHYKGSRSIISSGDRNGTGSWISG